MLESPIVLFLKKHHLLTVCTSKDNLPYCANCFYVLREKIATFVIATDSKTRHGQEALLNDNVAGTVALETNIVGKIQGIQFCGTYHKADKEDERAYFKRFPYALALSPELWRIRIEYLKFTDNTLGFGTKLEFRRIEP